MKITFNTAALAAILAAVKAAPEHREHWGEKTGPGFWLVGDDGVYLMGNHVQELPESGKLPVVYCDQAPAGDFDAKCHVFGHDDGVEFLDLKGVEAWIANAQEAGREKCEMNLTGSGLALVTYVKKAALSDAEKALAAAKERVKAETAAKALGLDITNRSGDGFAVVGYNGRKKKPWALEKDGKRYEGTDAQVRIRFPKKAA